MEDTPIWYLPGEGDENIGPLTGEDVVERLRRGRIGPATACWHKGMEDWEPISELDEFADALRELRSRRAKRVRTGVGWLVLVAVVVGCGWFIWQKMLGPAPVRQARKLVAAGMYEDAGRVLAPYLRKHPESAKAHATMGEVTMLMLMTRSQPWAARSDPLADKDYAVALGFMKAGANLDRSVWSQLAEALSRAEREVPPGSDDALGRIVAIQAARQTLELSRDDELVEPVLEAARHLDAQQRTRQLTDPIVRQLLAWQPEKAGNLLELQLAADSDPAHADVARRAEALRAQAGDHPDARAALARVVLAFAGDLADGAAVDRALSAAAEIDETASDDVAKERLRSLRGQIEQGDAEAAWRRLQGRGSGLEGVPVSEQADLHLSLARALRETNPRFAVEAFDKAMQLDPDREASADDLVATLSARVTPGPEKFTLYQQFLTRFPAESRRPKIQLSLIGDASSFVRSAGRSQPEVAASMLEGAMEAALELIDRAPRSAGLDDRVFDLAQAATEMRRQDPAANHETRVKALDLTAKLLAARPDTARRIEIGQARDGWRKEIGLGTLPPQLDAVAGQVEGELKSKLLLLTAPGAVRHLQDRSQSVGVVEVAETCGASKFSSEEAEILKEWVAGGGVVWARNDVIELFGISGTHIHFSNRQRETAPAAGPEVSPIMRGVARVVVHAGWNTTVGTYYDLQHPDVTPLLADSEHTYWSLVRYGDGWVSNATPVDVNQFDGARFWLNFRLFCLGREIPDAREPGGPPTGGDEQTAASATPVPAALMPAPPAANRPPTGPTVPAPDSAVADNKNPVPSNHRLESAAADNQDPPATPDPLVSQVSGILLKLDPARPEAGLIDSLDKLAPKLRDPALRERCREIVALGRLHALGAIQRAEMLVGLRAKPGESGFLKNLEDVCPDCKGSGKRGGACPDCRAQGRKICLNCSGRGQVYYGPRRVLKLCPQCNGQKSVPCARCKGTRKVGVGRCPACDGFTAIVTTESVRRRLQALLTKPPGADR